MIEKDRKTQAVINYMLSVQIEIQRNAVDAFSYLETEFERSHQKR